VPDCAHDIKLHWLPSGNDFQLSSRYPFGPRRTKLFEVSDNQRIHNLDGNQWLSMQFILIQALVLIHRLQREPQDDCSIDNFCLIPLGSNRTAHVGKLEIRAAGMTFLETARWHLGLLFLRRINLVARCGLFCVTPRPKGVVKQLGARGFACVHVDVARVLFQFRLRSCLAFFVI